MSRFRTLGNSDNAVDHQKFIEKNSSVFTIHFGDSRKRNVIRALAKRPITTRILSVFMLWTVALTTSYLPLPVPTLKDVSTPFPCQAKGCGCQNAGQCWGSCCCNTDAEKLAWARKNNVQPPAWFQEKMQLQSSDDSQPACGGCCGNRCEAPISLPQKPSCCQQVTQHDCCKTDQPKPTWKFSNWLCIEQVRGCRGQTDDYIHLEIHYAPPSEPELDTPSPVHPFSDRIELGDPQTTWAPASPPG